MADAEVRTATTADAAEIARIQLSTWRTAYAELLPATAWERLDEEEVAQHWAETIADGPAHVLLATEGPWAVGFCAAGTAPESESAAADGTPAADASAVALLSALLVEPRWGRRGHGGRLVARAGEVLRQEGITRGITWTAESDSASMFFFRRLGWAPDGTVRTLEADGQIVREMRLSGGWDVPLREGNPAASGTADIDAVGAAQDLFDLPGQ
ncbi:GNAT family N-acetyltransferase [Salinifilum aidingensis]